MQHFLAVSHQFLIELPFLVPQRLEIEHCLLYRDWGRRDGHLQQGLLAQRGDVGASMDLGQSVLRRTEIEDPAQESGEHPGRIRHAEHQELAGRQYKGVGIHEHRRRITPALGRQHNIARLQHWRLPAAVPVDAGQPGRVNYTSVAYVADLEPKKPGTGRIRIAFSEGIAGANRGQFADSYKI